MDFHLDRLLNLPNVTVFTCQQQEDFILLKLNLLNEGISCPHCQNYTDHIHQTHDDPFIVKNRSVIHKIGVTGGDVKKRIANAKKDPTYILAEVEIVATFKLADINPKKLEALLHKFFDNARLNVELQDCFGTPVKPREWFLVPLEVIEEVIEKIKAGTIDQFRYDPETASLTRVSE